MAIETTLQRRQRWMYPAYAIMCFGFALWGAYDYFVSIPDREAAVQRFTQASAERERIQGLPQPLPPETVAAYQQAEAVIASFKGEMPTPPAAYDRPVQLWIYMIGCGVISTPWFLWAWWSSARRKYVLQDDGTLITPQGTVAAEDMADIDMSRWMSKSIATVKTTDGHAFKLDDYKYKNTHLIVGSIAQRFYPEDWTEDARDRHKLEAEAAEAEEARRGDTQVDATGQGYTDSQADDTHVYRHDDSKPS
jgi:hypothetical protein